jgi:hypothetical protein
LTITVAVLNFASDAVLVVFPIPKVWALNTGTSRRLTTIALFGTRLLVCMMAIVDVTYAARIFRFRDASWDQFAPTITLIVLTNLSLISAAVPRLHKFLVTIPSGQATTRLPSFVVPSRPGTNRAGTTPGSAGQNSGNEGNSDVPKLVPDYPVVLTTHISSGSKLGAQVVSTNAARPTGAYIEDEKASAGSSSSGDAQADGIHRAVSVQYHVRRED